MLANARGLHQRPHKSIVLLMIAAILLVAVPWLGLQFGATELSWQQVWAGLWGYSTSYVERVVMGLRLPRTLVGLMIGVHFALSGGLLQLLTRNPLAEAGILGISARASLVAVAAFVVGIGYKRATTLTGAFPSH